MCFEEDSTLDQDYVTKYFVRRRGESGNLYLTRQRIPVRDITNMTRYEGIPSSISRTTAYPQTRQVSTPTRRAERDSLDVWDEQQAFKKTGSPASSTRESWESSPSQNDAKNRRVRFCLPDAPDVVYPDAEENLRTLRAQFDGISDQEEDWARGGLSAVHSRPLEDRDDDSEPTSLDECSLGYRQERIPRGILKNRMPLPEIPKIPRPTYSQNPNKMSKTFYYIPPQHGSLSPGQSQRVRRLRILRPPPLPEGRVWYGSEEEARANRHVRFNVGWSDFQDELPTWNDPAPSHPPPQEQNVPWQSQKEWREPMKPVPAYVRSEDEEAKNQQDSVEW